MITLNGITWDHPRGYDPLIAASISFTKNNSNVIINWKKRTLEEFGDFPIEKLVQKYDLVMVDHPYMGEAHSKKLFVPLNEFLNEKEINSRKTNSVGLSFESYIYNDKLLALACDAAAQVSVYLKDKVNQNELPKNWDDLLYFSKKMTIAVPLCAVDMWCVFLTLCSQLSDNKFFGENINEEIGINSLEMIYKLLEISDSISIHSNPIEIMNLMTSEKKIVYSPYLFGYSNYSRKSFDTHLIFDNVFTLSSKHSSLLGGVGIAVSSKSKYIETAIDFAKFVTDPMYQAGEYYRNNGQPAYLTAWDNVQINKNCNNFFINTIDTLENSYMRPRIPGFNRFQEYISKEIHSSIKNRVSPSKIIQIINKSIEQFLNKE